MDKKWIGLIVGIAVFLIVLLLPLGSVLDFSAQTVIAITALMVVFWIAQPIPIIATSLIPLVAFPLLGIMSVGDTALSYADNIVFLFLGGFLIAIAMQKWNLHKRIALKLIKITGTSPSRLILGFMIATAFLSMWMSNSATATMMIPIAIAIILTVIPHKKPSEMDKSEKAFAGALVIGVAYSAAIGGIATLIGTPANAIFVSMLENFFPEAPTIDFFEWLILGVPFAAIMLFIAWVWLTKVIFRKMPKKINNTKEILNKQIDEMGPMTQGEKNTLIVFILAALMWIFKDPKNIGIITIPGINSLYEGGIIPFQIEDSMIAIFCAILLFIIPASLKPHNQTLDWKCASKIPWDILLLVGSGISLSAAFKASGLSEAIGHLFYKVDVPIGVLVILVGIVIIILSELASNTAIANIMIPIMVGVSLGLAINPLILMLTATLASSIGFMLPIATPPNTLAYGTKYVNVKEMVSAGWIMNLAGLLLITVFIFMFIIFGLGMDISLPEWAIII